MAKVKGTFLLEYARLIRANKDRDWKKYLSEEDMKIILGMVMPNTWYPIEIMQRAGEAVFMEIGQGKLENAKAWGRFMLEDTGNRFYRNLVTFQDPVGSLERIKTFLRQWFWFDDPNFPFLDVKEEAPNRVKMIMRYDSQFASFEAYAWQFAGTVERVVELNGGKEVKAEITEHDYRSDNPFVTILVSWK